MSYIIEGRFAELEKSVKQVLANQEYAKTMAYAIYNHLAPANAKTIEAMAYDAKIRRCG